MSRFMALLLSILTIGCLERVFAQAIEGTNCTEIAPEPTIECVGWDRMTIQLPNGSMSFAD